MNAVTPTGTVEAAGGVPSAPIRPEMERELRRLRFSDADVERAFRDDYVQRRMWLFRLNFWIGLAIQAPVSVRFVFVEDIPPTDPRFWIRLTVGVVSALIGLYLTRSPQRHHLVERYMVLYVLLIGGTLELLFARLPDGWTHLMVFLAAALLLPRHRVPAAALVAVSLIAFHILVAVLAVERPGAVLGESLPRVGLLTFFLLVAVYMVEHSARRDFLLLRLLGRERFASAVGQERRRIERDLHDGAQQRLVAGTMWLDVLDASLTSQRSQRVRESMQRIGDTFSGAIQDLRELTHGGIPTLLAREGLDAALAALVARAPGAVTLHGRAGGNLPGPAAAAAYFAVAEGLTNAARHSGASSIEVRVSRDDDRLCIEVADDGAGGAELGAGSGLLGLRTRVADQGGKLTLESPIGAGTLLRVELPLEPVPIAGGA
ncbi:MAG: histidine kinase [Chloroflexota bacterium]|nr:histidine kinase [Chloroflexota bacterium]